MNYIKRQGLGEMRGQRDQRDQDLSSVYRVLCMSDSYRT